MICPYCQHENIDGADNCENCLEDLHDLNLSAGRSPLETSLMEESLSALKIRKPVFIAPQASVAEAVSLLSTSKAGCLLVGAAECVRGVFSERDVLLRVAHEYEQVRGRPVAEFMTPDPVSLEADAALAFALNRMAVGDFRQVPVTDQGRYVGIVAVTDVLGFLSEWYPDLFAPA